METFSGFDHFSIMNLSYLEYINRAGQGRGGGTREYACHHLIVKPHKGHLYGSKIQ